MSEIEKKLIEMNIDIPIGSHVSGTYVSARWSGNYIYVSGNGPKIDGKIACAGKIGNDLTIEEGYYAARLSMINIIGVLKNELGDLDKIEKFVKLVGFIASADDFYEQTKVLNGASDLLVEVFGDKGIHARSAVGVNVLPFNQPVVIETVVEIKV